MSVNFLKMQGIGNDFILINGINYKIDNYNQTAKFLCDRHFGIGGDGLIIILPPESEKNNYKMRIFNADGSEAEMCGNGIRCFTHYLRQKKLSEDKKIRVETLAGIITPEILKYSETDQKCQVKVNMGKPKFKPELIPIKVEKRTDFVEDYQLATENTKFKINCVSMGNPHTIIFEDDIEQIDLSKWGEKIENHSLFPEKTNVEFIEIINSTEIKMRVWERGSGITLACGTGACASAVAGIKKGLIDNDVTVHLPGGNLKIKWNGNNVIMTGPSEIVFEGKIKLTH